MIAGLLSHRVEIQAPTESRDAFGGVTRSWSTVKRRWARIQSGRGREFIQASQQRADITHVVQMRYTTGVTNAHRLKFGSRVLNIESVLEPDAGRRELMLYCTEVV